MPTYAELASASPRSSSRGMESEEGKENRDEELLTEEVDPTSRTRTFSRASLKKASFDEADDSANLFTMSFEDAIDKLGISAFCIFSTQGMDLFKIVLVAMQCLFLQFAILWYMTKRLKPYDVDELGEKDIDRLILTVAVYLHVVNCIADMPFGLTTIQHFCALKSTRLELMITAPLFFVDALVTPSFTLVIGSLYLCTSRTVTDVILNSCGVAFITNIDNWILSLNHSMNKMQGHFRDEELSLPLAKSGGMNLVNWLTCILPILPGAGCIIMVHIGCDIMEL